MNLIRRFALSLTLSLATIFCLEQVAYMAFNEFDFYYVSEFIDFDSSTETSEDQKEEKKIKEYKLQIYNSVYLESLYTNSCAKYGQLGINPSLEVFLDIVTPPPEA